MQTDCPVLLLAGNKQEECGPNTIKVAGSAISMDVGRSFTIAVDISPCNEERGAAVRVGLADALLQESPVTSNWMGKAQTGNWAAKLASDQTYAKPLHHNHRKLLRTCSASAGLTGHLSTSPGFAETTGVYLFRWPTALGSPVALQGKITSLIT